MGESSETPTPDEGPRRIDSAGGEPPAGRSQDAAAAPYAGLPGRTRQRGIHYTCGACGFLFGARIYGVVDVGADPALGESLARGELNALACPACGVAGTAAVPLVYHDPRARRFALVVPDALRHQELELRAQLLLDLAADEAHVPDYTRRADVVYGTAGLLRLLDESQQAQTPQHRLAEERAQALAQFDEQRGELERRAEELLAREEDLQAKQEDLVSGTAKLERAQDELGAKWAELERERAALRALAVDLEARERAQRERAREETEKTQPRGEATGKTEKYPRPERTAPGVGAPAGSASEAALGLAPLLLEGRPQLEVDRWRAGELRVAQLLHEERVFLLAKLAPEQLVAYTATRPTLRLQLFDLERVPLLVMLVLPGGAASAPGATPPPVAPLCWTIDASAEVDRALLQRLAVDCRLHLDLYDEEARVRATWEVVEPLAENARALLERADALRAERGRDGGHGDLAAARRAHEALGEERLGKKQHNFSADSFQEVATPGGARLALGIVGYWSQPENQEYLVQVKSFPLVYWRAIRERVVRRALECGLRLTPPLLALALEQKLAASRDALLRAAVASFAEVSLRIRPSDLDPAQEWDNWKLLLADCVQAKVQVDPEIEKLAAVAAKRAGALDDSATPGGDLSLLGVEKLLPLLVDRDQRRDAALELCERGSARAAEPVFSAICNMTRGEVARVLPAMIQLGPKVVALLAQGLRHRKSFIRQGCALALGAMKAAAGVEGLMDLLLAEPTNVWKEAARALGDMGAVSLGALIAGLKNADAAGRERIAWALAQSAMDARCAAEVEAMAKGRDTRLARVASRALELHDQVRQADSEVRGPTPLSEQTVVRSFSRRFFESLSPEVSELGEGDIVESEEVLDDGDILDEEVQVDDDDILNDRSP